MDPMLFSEEEFFGAEELFAGVLTSHTEEAYWQSNTAEESNRANRTYSSCLAHYANMASNGGPYYIDMEDFRKFPGPSPSPYEPSPSYPEPEHSSAPDANIYVLADGALQAHQEHNQFANLVQAAERVTHENEGEPAQDEADHQTRSTRKRKRKGSVDSNGQQGVGERGSNGAENDEHTASAGARAGLFRATSTRSKKYTRPPMDKLYSSFRLPPQNFLQLQSAAKNYMLDPEHPDRLEKTVGQRGKNDSELVKLALYECVKDFLEQQGNGMKFFGEHITAEDGSPRRWTWPHFKNELINLVTPLLRRMVTNERQRRYAIETRKPGQQSDSKKVKKANGTTDTEEWKAQKIPAVQIPPTSKALFYEMTGADLEKYPVVAKYAIHCPGADPTIAAQIDSLRAHSTALEPEFLGIVGAIDYHLRVTHREPLPNGTPCNVACEDEFTARMAGSSLLQHVSNAQFPPSNPMQPSQDIVPQFILQAYRLVRDIVDRTPTFLSDVAAAGLSSFTLPPDHPPINTNMTTDADPKKSTDSSDGQSAASKRLMLHMSYVGPTGARLTPKRVVPAERAPYLHSVAQEAMLSGGPSETLLNGKRARVRVLTEEGLLEVKDDGEWRAAVESVREKEWMDGIVTVVVDLFT